MCGCASEENELINNATKESCIVTFGPAYVNAVATKSNSSFLPKDSVMCISAYQVQGSNGEMTSYAQTKNFTIADDAGTLNYDNGKMCLLKGNTYNFYAYYPALPFKQGSTKTVVVNAGDDFMLSSVAANLGSTESNVALPTMSRKCSKVFFAFRTDINNKIITGFRIGSKGITLLNQTQSPAYYTLGEDKIQISNLPQTGVVNVAGDNSDQITGNNIYRANLVVLPKKENPFTLNVDIQLGNKLVPLVATIPSMEFKPGMSYNYLVLISDEIIKIFLVSNWTDVPLSTTVGSSNTAVTVGKWAIVTDGTNLGDPNTNITVSPWIVNPSWEAELGASNFKNIVSDWVAPDGNTSNVNAGQGNVVNSVNNWDTSVTYTEMGVNN